MKFSNFERKKFRTFDENVSTALYALAKTCLICVQRNKLRKSEKYKIFWSNVHCFVFNFGLWAKKFGVPAKSFLSRVVKITLHVSLVFWNFLHWTKIFSAKCFPNLSKKVLTFRQNFSGMVLKANCWVSCGTFWEEKNPDFDKKTIRFLMEIYQQGCQKCILHVKSKF